MAFAGPKEVAIAARNGDLAELARLLSRGIDVNAVVEFGGTALVQAAAAGQKDAVAALLDAKANIEACTAVRAALLPLHLRRVPTRHVAAATVLTRHVAAATVLTRHVAAATVLTSPRRYKPLVRHCRATTRRCTLQRRRATQR
jgi:hypothetical protein